MSERNDNLRDHEDRTIGDVVDEKQDLLKKTFGLSPETARVTADDSVADRMRQPSSDVEEGKRIAAAQTSAADED